MIAFLGECPLILQPRLKRPSSIVNYYLGGLSSLVASYLARTRGSNEPELSIQRTGGLNQLIRDCETLHMDKGHLTSDDTAEKMLVKLRDRFEELLGNAKAERRNGTAVSPQSRDRGTTLSEG
ncbi:hypothetical protein PLICRDRAFT_39944 [Plicaturopsis crispa FD-325 SS-3]|nr:hypothetical protein PLICRDRAFT_39944 [Plicaturopsis crispa FD-325 SS-3]